MTPEQADRQDALRASSIVHGGRGTDPATVIADAEVYRLYVGDGEVPDPIRGQVEVEGWRGILTDPPPRRHRWWRRGDNR